MSVPFDTPAAGRSKFFVRARRVVCAGIIVVVLACGSVSMLARPVLPQLPKDVQADRVLIEKSARRLTLYAAGQVLAVYPVSLGRGGAGPKTREGDRLTPEGVYKISGRNPQSAYHLSLRISYPDEADKKRAAAAGVNPGSDIMIHGIRNGLGWLGTLHRYADWTQGCIALTNPEIAQLWRAVPDGTVVDIRP